MQQAKSLPTPLVIRNTGDASAKPSIVMLIYGEGGVGKTTFSSTAPKPILADCEGGAKYFGLRGIKMDVAQIQSWSQMREFLDLAKSDKYETIVIDPIGELMEKLMRHMIAINDSKLVQKDGSPTMAGWGWVKKTLRDYIKVIRDSGKHVLLIAHIEERSDEDRMIKRPKIQTKLADDLVNMVDIVGYMTSIQDQDGIAKRVIIVDPGNDKYTAKDRTGQLGRLIEPDFTKIVNACQGTETYAWSKQGAAKLPEQKKVEPEKVVDMNEITVDDLNKIDEQTSYEPIGMAGNVLDPNNPLRGVTPKQGQPITRARASMQAALEKQQKAAQQGGLV